MRGIQTWVEINNYLRIAMGTGNTRVLVLSQSKRNLDYMIKAKVLWLVSNNKQGEEHGQNNNKKR